MDLSYLPASAQHFWEQKWYSNASEVGFFLIPYHCHNRPMNVSLFAALRRRGTRLLAFDD